MLVKHDKIIFFADLTYFFLKIYNLGSKLWQHTPHIIPITKKGKRLTAFGSA